MVPARSAVSAMAPCVYVTPFWVLFRKVHRCWAFSAAQHPFRKGELCHSDGVSGRNFDVRGISSPRRLPPPQRPECQRRVLLLCSETIAVYTAFAPVVEHSAPMPVGLMAPAAACNSHSARTRGRLHHTRGSCSRGDCHGPLAVLDPLGGTC